MQVANGGRWVCREDESQETAPGKEGVKPGAVPKVKK